MDRNATEKTRNQFTCFCSLTFLVSDEGSLPEDYKNSDDYKGAGLEGDLYGFSTGLFSLDYHKAVVGTTKDEIVVAIKGTDGIMDSMNDGYVNPVDFEGMGKVHMGFASATALLLKNGLEKKVDELIRSNPQQGLCFTGHSKGGAVAFLLAAHYSNKNYSNNIRVITFEAPRVGNSTFAYNYEELGMETLRYEDFLDVVPHLPFTSQEHQLLDRMGPVNNFLENFMDIITCDYVPVGRRIGFYVGHDEYNGRYPHNEGNTDGESLNSMCAVEFLMRNHFSISLMNNEIHNKDYKESIVEYTDFDYLQ